MSAKPAKKSTKGRKSMDPGSKKIIIRASVPTRQARAAEEAASRLGMEWGDFVQFALKEAIYQAALSTDVVSRSAEKPLESLPDAVKAKSSRSGHA